MKVENIIGSNGNPVRNQFVITDGDVRTFQSYGSVICRIDGSGRVTLDERFWDYSQTTGKYRNIFLGEKKEETAKKIKSGEYALANLN